MPIETGVIGFSVKSRTTGLFILTMWGQKLLFWIPRKKVAFENDSVTFKYLMNFAKRC